MKLRILFFNPEQYVPFEHEPSNIQCRLPILNCGLEIEKFDHVYQRALRAEGFSAMEREALAAVDAVKPDLVVYSATWEHENLSSWTLAAIRQRGVPIISVLWDSWIEPTVSEVELFSQSDVFVVCDSLHTYLRCRQLATWESRERQIAFQGGHVFTDLLKPDWTVEKDIDVLILGSNEGERANLVSQLSEQLPPLGIRFAKMGGLVDSTRGDTFSLSDNWIDWPSYVRAINRAHICINGTTDPGRLQIKGKIFDYMACGSLCLTQTNVEIERFLPSNTVATFDDADSCINQIRELMIDTERRKAIAEAGYLWLSEAFDYRRFWKSVLLAALGQAKVENPTILNGMGPAETEGAVSALLRQQASLASIAAKTSFALGPCRREPLAWCGRHRGWYLLKTQQWGYIAVTQMPVDLLVAAEGPFLVGRDGFPQPLLKQDAEKSRTFRLANNIEDLKALIC